MRQALHIFRKDIRCLWWEILVVEALAIGYTFVKSESHDILYVNGLLPLAWIYLVVRVILQEPLPGDRQFWITRPYAWRSLLGAKALFVIAVINLPRLIS